MRYYSQFSIQNTRTPYKRIHAEQYHIIAAMPHVSIRLDHVNVLSTVQYRNKYCTTPKELTCRHSFCARDNTSFVSLQGC